MEDTNVWNMIDTYFSDNPQSLVRHHTESYNDFFKNGIFRMFKEKKPIMIQTNYDETIKDYRGQAILHLGGKDGSKIYFGKPVIYDENNSHFMFPNEARLRNMTYGMTIHYDIDVEIITIREPGELANLIGPNDLLVDDNEVNPEYVNVKKSTADLTELIDNENMEGGAIKNKNKTKKITSDATVAQQALIREMTEQSMKDDSTQVEEFSLKKLLLGKFPIMVQSDYCVLSGLPRETRFSMGECRNDVGGYFIIDGKEKTIVSQEKFGDNLLYIKESGDENYLYSAEIKSVSENVSKPIRQLSVKIVAPNEKFTFKNIVVSIPNVRNPIPLFILFRALGFTTDKQIINMCLLDMDKYENMIDLFIPSVHDAGGIMTQELALKYIASFTKEKNTTQVLYILADYFLPHIGETNFLQKAYFLGYITFRLLKVYVGIDEPTDRDNFKYKRIELVGTLLNGLFGEFYSLQHNAIRLGYERKYNLNKAIYENNLRGLIEQNTKEIFNARILESGVRRGFKGDWGATSHTKRVGVIQDLNRLSFCSALSHLRKTNLPLDPSVKVVGPRVLHGTQWGFFDPIDTPDGGNIGLHKHLSISSYITQSVSREPLIQWLREKVEMKLLEDCIPINISRMTKIFVNGFWCGVIDNPRECVEKIRLFRRNALLPIYTSVTFDVQQNVIFIYNDGGRICRPIFYRDTDTQKMSFENPKIQKYIEDKKYTWQQLISGFNNKKLENFNTNNYNMYELHELYDNINSESNPAKLQRFNDEKAIIDYIDSSETENTLIALNKEQYEADTQSKYTHMELHESLIFGVMSNLIIFPENNPATRNSFSCGQSKQASSMYHTNHQLRMDKTAVVLNYGQIPLVKTRYMEHINNEENVYGENTIVAIMCYTGYNVEDAILINEGALKRGLFRTTYYSTYETHEETDKSGDGVSETRFGNIENDTTVVGSKPGYDYSKLDKYGLIRENTVINEKTVLIGMTTSDGSDKKVDSSKTPKKGQLGIVDKTFITEGEEGTRIAKVRVREVRIPNLGDKMASRAGQKGTIGLVVPESDMPFTKDGVRPDIIINPHAIPSRMTIGHLVECIIGKSAAMYGGFGDCTAFVNKGTKINKFGEMLTKVGYHSSGNDILYNGMTGEQIESEIFVGPNYYMRLKHMVKDKINHRALGPRTALTRQAVSGRANDGGLRIGEMERDVVISIGASEFLRESMMERGDKYKIAICNTSGLLAIYNPAKNIFMSPMADGPIKFIGNVNNTELNVENITKHGRTFSVVNVPYSFKLLMQELGTINVQMRFITEDNINQIENMTYSKNIDKLMYTKDADIEKIIKDNQQLLEESRKNTRVNTSDTIDSFSPIVQSPEYPPSPEYQTNSPGDIMNNKSFESSTDTSIPKYRALEDTPNTSPLEPPPGQYPNSPLEPPPLSDEDKLAELAKTYDVGDNVYYRGDTTMNRLWTVSNVGDRFLKIETDIPSNDNTDVIQVVTANDIYRTEDVKNFSNLSTPTNTPPPPLIRDDLESMDSNISSMSGGNATKYTQPATIHFAPVIKVTNGSTEMSTDGLLSNNVEPNQLDDMIKMNNDVIQHHNQVTELPTSIIDTPTEGPIDFNNFVIKKI